MLEYLHGIEFQLRAMNAPATEALRPGVPSSISRDRVMQELGMALPDEAALWWSWHDGIDVRPHAHLAHWELLSLDRAFDVRRSFTEFAAEMIATEPDMDPTFRDTLWRDNWFPFAQNLGGRPLVIELGDPHAYRVHMIETHDAERIAYTAPDLATVARYWLMLLEERVWEYDESLGRWVRHYERLPPDQPRGGPM